MTPIYDQVSEYLSGPKCLGVVLLIASIPCIVSTICAFILSPLDKRRTKVLKLDNRHDLLATATNERKTMFDIFKFPVQFWLIVTICTCFYSITFPFISLGKLFFIRKYNASPSIASLQQSLFFFITVVTSPLFGILVDKTGYNIIWVIFSNVLAIGSHVLLMFSFFNSFVATILLGTSLSLLATSLWPMVSLLVKKNQLGTAFGL